MKNLLFSLFAIGLAGIAAIAATTAVLNTPVHNIGAVEEGKAVETGQSSEQTNPDKTAPDQTDTKDTTPAEPAAPDASDSSAEPSAASAPAAGADKPADAAAAEPEADVDPYQGISREELPPDLQYDADSSISFPTNT